MKSTFKILVTILVFVCIAESRKKHYNFNKNGADWGGVCKTGVRQSPITFVKDDVPACEKA